MLIEMGRDAVRAAMREGVDSAEAFSVSTRTVAVYVEDSRVKNVEEKLDRGMALRVIMDGRQGAVSTSIGSGDDVRGMVGRAVQATRMSNPDPDLRGFVPSAEANIAAPGVWDPRIADAQGADIMEFAKGIVEAALDKGEVRIPRGLIRAATMETTVANSNGVEATHRNTMYYLHYTSMVTSPRPGEGVRSAFGTGLDIDVEGIGERLYEGARNAAKARPYRGGGQLTAIIPPGELAEMMLTTLGAASGENVNFKRSRWTDSMNEEVASKEVTVIDDPTDARGLLCSRFDDEGCPTSRKALVEGGVLRSLYHDSYSAGMAGAEDTGNGIRRSSIDPQGIYRNPVGCRLMNMVMCPGRRSPEEVVSDVEEGVLIERFAWPDVDALTGRFGLEVRCGHLVRNGEIVETINHALLMGNMYDAIKNVRCIGNDATVVGRAIVPTVSFDGIELIG